LEAAQKQGLPRTPSFTRAMLEENGYGGVSICKALLEKCAYKVECKIR